MHSAEAIRHRQATIMVIAPGTPAFTAAARFRTHARAILIGGVFWAPVVLCTILRVGFAAIFQAHRGVAEIAAPSRFS